MIVVDRYPLPAPVAEPAEPITVGSVFAQQGRATKIVNLHNVPTPCEEDVLLDLALPAAGERPGSITGWRVTFHHDDAAAVVYLHVD